MTLCDVSGHSLFFCWGFTFRVQFRIRLGFSLGLARPSTTLCDLSCHAFLFFPGLGFAFMVQVRVQVMVQFRISTPISTTLCDVSCNSFFPCLGCTFRVQFRISTSILMTLCDVSCHFLPLQRGVHLSISPRLAKIRLTCLIFKTQKKLISAWGRSQGLTCAHPSRSLSIIKKYKKSLMFKNKNSHTATWRRPQGLTCARLSRTPTAFANRCPTTPVKKQNLK